MMMMMVIIIIIIIIIIIVIKLRTAYFRKVKKIGRTPHSLWRYNVQKTTLNLKSW